MLHLICSLMQQTRPTASLAKIKRLSALCKMEGTRVPGPFHSLGCPHVVVLGRFLHLPLSYSPQTPRRRIQHYVDLTCPPKAFQVITIGKAVLKTVR